MREPDSVLRAEALEALEAIPSLDMHGETIRLILAEASLLANKYRCVRRHDIPHIAELIGLFDLLSQEVDMSNAPPPTEPAIFAQV